MPCVLTVMSRIRSCNHTLHSSRCGLSKGSNPTLRRSDFVAVWVCINLIVGLIFVSYLLSKMGVSGCHIQRYVVPLGTGWRVPMLLVIRYNITDVWGWNHSSFILVAVADHYRSIRELANALSEEGGSAASGLYVFLVSAARAWLQKYWANCEVGRGRGTGCPVQLRILP